MGYISGERIADGSYEITLFQKNSRFSKGDHVVVYGTHAVVKEGPDHDGMFRVEYGDGLTSFRMPEFIMKKDVNVTKVMEEANIANQDPTSMVFKVGQQVWANHRIAVVTFAYGGKYKVNFSDNSESSDFLQELDLVQMSEDDTLKLAMDRLASERLAG